MRTFSQKKWAGQLDSYYLTPIAIAFLLLSGLVNEGLGQTRTRIGEPAQVAEINRMIEEDWRKHGLKPSKDAEDYEWCRRVYLDVIGRIPTVDELQQFQEWKSKERYEKLVDQLLYSDAYVDELTRNWTTLWTNRLIGRTGGTNRRSRIDRSGMQQYLRESLLENKPYDQMAHELIVASGTSSPDSEQFNGATNFLIDKVNDENGAQATAATSRLFLGLQLQCTQCHNHPFNDWKQQKYWEFNAFFRQTRATRGNLNPRDGEERIFPELIDRDYSGESNRMEEADLFYELRNGLVKVAYPVFVDGTTIERHGAVDQVRRREELAKLILASPYFDQAIVNRMWSHFLGYGFTSQVDDLGPHSPPSNPELFGYLATEFRESRYDLRELMRWIILSRPYRLSSRISRKNDKDDPLAGKPPRFSHFYLRQMRAEELYESLLIATRVEENQLDYEELERRKSRWLQQFVTTFGTDEGDEMTIFNGTIPQTLMMFNGEMIRQATSVEDGSLLERLANDTKMSARDKINYLFLSGLSRRATRQEVSIAEQLFELRDGDGLAAMQDLWWVILNSNEFIFNH